MVEKRSYLIGSAVCFQVQQPVQGLASAACVPVVRVVQVQDEGQVHLHRHQLTAEAPVMSGSSCLGSVAARNHKFLSHGNVC